MLDILSLDDVRGNNVTVYSIKTLLEKKRFPKFSILSGRMGVGKSTVANLVATTLCQDEMGVKIFNFGTAIDMEEIESAVFSRNPAKPRAFVFEELHGLDKGQQTALLTMLDSQPPNAYVLCTTTELHKVLNTIKSRATVWSFKLLGERQLSQLLDDYLNSKGVYLSSTAKASLLRSAHGVPRDLLKNADFAISGEFSDQQLSELLGQVSEDLIFSLLCSLKSTSIDFVSSMQSIIEDVSKDKLIQLRDFYTRFLLERHGVQGATIDPTKVSTLVSLYTSEELEKIGRTLIRATADTLMLELTLLNMELTNTSSKQLIGQQIDKVARAQAESPARMNPEVAAERVNRARVTASSLKGLKLNDEEV